MDAGRIGRIVNNRVQRALTRMRLAVARTTGRPVVHLLHVGKTGGTAVKDALQARLGEGHYTLLLQPHTVTLRDVRPGEKAVFFLRHPVSRFVSGFYSRQRQGLPRYFVPWAPEEKIAFARFPSANALAHGLKNPDAALRAQAVEAMHGIHHVRDSFYRWFMDETYFASRRDDILFIGFQERLDRDFEALQDILGFAARSTLPTTDKAAHRNPQRDEKLDALAVQNLTEWYARDIAFYDLCAHMFPPPEAR